MNYRFFLFQLFLLFFSVSYSCKDRAANSEQDKQTPPSMDGTAEMAKLLDDIEKRIDINKTPYLFNKRRVEYFKSLVDQAQGVERIQYSFRYGLELINAGNPEQAIVELEAIRQMIQSSGGDLPKQEKLLLLKNLALAYLRLGEQENCIENNKIESCLVPISPEGVYDLQTGSKNAISIYKEILELDPKDYESIWLLNLAYMTIGEYPKGVPAPFLIPEKSFRNSKDFPKFKNMAKQAGVTDNRLAGSCIVDDLNNDGWLDIVASSWGLDDQIKIFLNTKNSKFEEVTEQSGLTGITGGLNIVPADVDNNGYLDFLILRGAWFDVEGNIPNSLIKNNGDGTFQDVTKSAGLLSFHPTQTATWFDVNKDGWIDLFIGNESTINAAHHSEFFLNNGDGTFTEMAKQLGLDVQVFTKGCTSGDINNDGWPDLYISVYNDYNKLLLHNGESDISKIKFTDIAESAGVKEPLYSFPTWFFDFNNDGWQDLFVSGYGNGEKSSSAQVCRNLFGEALGGNPRLYLNNGNNTFTDYTQKAGLTDAIFTMGSNYGDLDNDGFLDFYLTTGNPSFSSIYPNRMFRNNAGKSLNEVTYGSGFGHIQKGHGVGFGDIDNDGDAEIYIVVGGAYDGDYFENLLYENPVGNKMNWIKVQLIGTKSNKMAIGARVKLVASDKAGKKHEFYRTVTWGGSFGSSCLRQEIGIGDCVKIEMLEIIWPNREQSKQTFTDLSIKEYIRITEGSAEIEKITLQPVQ